MDLAMDLIREALLGGSGGGGGGGVELVYSSEKNITATSTEEEIEEMVTVDAADLNPVYLFYAYDKAGPRNGHFYGMRQFGYKYPSSQMPTTVGPLGVKYASNGSKSYLNSVGGVYMIGNASGKLVLCSKSTSTSLTVEGTFVICLYKITTPVILFE